MTSRGPLTEEIKSAFTVYGRAIGVVMFVTFMAGLVLGWLA